MKWLIELLISSKKLRGLTDTQLRELIKNMGDVESVRLLKAEIENGTLKYAEYSKAELLQLCGDQARKLHWEEHLKVIKKTFMDHIVDPFADHIDMLQ